MGEGNLVWKEAGKGRARPKDGVRIIFRGKIKHIRRPRGGVPAQGREATESVGEESECLRRHQEIRG